MRRSISGVTTGAGEYAPMPPVFGPEVAVVAAFVVLAAWPAAATCRPSLIGDVAGLFAVEEFLDHDAGGGVAKRVRAEHVVQRLFGIGQRECDHDAFAGRQTVGLDDDGRAVWRTYASAGLSSVNTA